MLKSFWKSEEIFQEGDRFFDALLGDIERAQESVALETYIFERDELGERVLAALESAARRGLKVRLLVDAIGSPSLRQAAREESRERGFEIRLFHPMRWSLRSIQKTLNRRNHRKVCIIDGRIAFVGGMNVSQHHLRQLSGKAAWRDTSVRVEGAAVRELQAAFELAWQRRSLLARRLGTFTRRSFDPDALVRLNDSFFKRRKYYQDLIRRVLNARKRVWITSPYFVPEISLLQALRWSAWSGVDVRLLVPAKNDLFFMRWINGAFFGLLLKAGVRVFEYAPRMHHSKTILIDDWITVGSSNMNHRSLLHDLEVNVVLKHDASARALEEHFMRDLSHSREVAQVKWTSRSWMVKIAEHLLMRLKYWL